jgi:hypothetical protein
MALAIIPPRLTHEPIAIDGPDLLAHILNRMDQIERILSFHKLEPGTVFARLNGVEFKCVDEVRIRYLAHVFGRAEPVPSEEERVQAHFDGRSIFYFVGNGELAWREIAKELAVLACPGKEPGSLAASLKEVLASANRIEAERSLDDLGFPPAAVAIGVTPEEAPIEQIGNAGGEPSSASGQILVGSAGGPTQRTGGEGAEGSPSGGGSSVQDGTILGPSTGRSRAVPAQPQSRLPVYVETGDGPSRPSDEESRERLKEVDRKGVDRVRKAEIEAGRQPRVMPHNNEGFDIESKNE